MKTDGVLTRLTVDGVDMSHALSVVYTHKGGDIPKLTMVLPVEEAILEGAISIEEKTGHTGENSVAKRTIGSLLLDK